MPVASPAQGGLHLDLVAFDAATLSLTLEEEGALLRLLRAAAVSPGGYLPGEPDRLMRIVRATGPEWRRIGEAVISFLKIADGLASFPEAPGIGTAGLPVGVALRPVSAAKPAAGGLRAQMFSLAIEWMRNWGVGEVRAKGLITTWVKTYGPGPTLSALLAADKACSNAAVVDPVSWINGRLIAEQKGPAEPRGPADGSKGARERPAGRRLSRPTDLATEQRSQSISAQQKATAPLIANPAALRRLR